jgi:hypothetical protein
LPAGLQAGANSRIGCNSELAETKSNTSFHLSSEMGILGQGNNKRNSSNDV